MSRRLFVPLFAAAVAFGAPVLAAPAADGPSVTVRVADLDLESPLGARAALRRIQRAAVVVCGGEPDSRALDRQAAFQACVRTATARTVAQSRSPTLAALNGTPLPHRVLAAAD
jgi:UrcA family protein